jgi:3-hydroxyacyl-[acyl-carrier-protein] dehydratase
MSKLMEKCLFNAEQIKAILPHRYPFLLVDKIIEIDLEKRVIIGQKNLTINEHFFQGHFPDVPIMPGVLMLEALAQTGGILIHQRGFIDKIAVFLSINNCKFRRPAKPGDVLVLRAEEVHLTSKGGKMFAKAFVNGDNLAVEAEIGFALVDKSHL